MIINKDGRPPDGYSLNPNSKPPDETISIRRTPEERELVTYIKLGIL